MANQMPMFSVVPKDQIGMVPYPYVYVTDTGEVHELVAKDREYLETELEPGDGNRPYVKSTYTDNNGWGRIQGFCPRSAIPKDIQIDEEPVYFEPSNPSPEIIEEITDEGEFTITEYIDDPFTVTLHRNQAPKRWWQFWRK